MNEYSIQSEVKTDVTLNADAKVSLDKGAEGSSVTAGNENVKPDVTNNTSESITITDSTGNDTTVNSGSSNSSTGDTNKDDSNSSSGSTGGDYTGGGNTTPAVTITPTITMTEDKVPATVLKPGVALRASATNSVNAEVTYSYSWVSGEECVGTTDTYTVTNYDSGDTITVWVTAVINGKEVSASQTTGIVKTVAHKDEEFEPTNIPYGVPTDEAPNFLNGMIRIADACGYTTGAEITWSSSDYNGNEPGTYTFTGTIALPNENWVWASDEESTIKTTVTVLDQDALSFSYSKYSPESAGENVTYNQAHMSISAGTNSYTCYVAANTLKLKKYTIAGEEHQWIGVNVKVENLPASDDAAVGLEYSKDGKEWGDVGTGIVTHTDVDNTVTVWLPFDTCKDSYEVVYLRKKGGDSSVSTPITFSFTEEYLELTAVTPVSIEPIEAGTYGGTILTISEMMSNNMLPSKLEFTDVEGETHEIAITWKIYEDYQNAAGTYYAWAVLSEEDPIYLVNVTLPVVKIIVKPETIAASSSSV